jgi:hypothetical protein
MALRYDHSFGLPSDMPGSLSLLTKARIITQMRQLWEEVAGVGFYKGPGTYTALWDSYDNLLKECDQMRKEAEEISAALETLGMPEYSGSNPEDGPDQHQFDLHAIGELRQRIINTGDALEKYGDHLRTCKTKVCKQAEAWTPELLEEHLICDCGYEAALQAARG